MNENNSLKMINQLIEQFFSVFDNRFGKKPGFSIFNHIFFPQATISKRNSSGIEIMSLKEFLEPRKDLLTNGDLIDFHEWETDSKTLIHNGIATRISAYRKKGILYGKPYEGEGIKHIQVLFSGKNWKIISILWEDDIK